MSNAFGGKQVVRNPNLSDLFPMVRLEFLPRAELTRSHSEFFFLFFPIFFFFFFLLKRKNSMDHIQGETDGNMV